MKKVVLVMVLVTVLFSMTYGVFVSFVREIDLHPYGGQGIMKIQGRNGWVDWDNGTRSYMKPGDVEFWANWLEG